MPVVLMTLGTVLVVVWFAARLSTKPAPRGCRPARAPFMLGPALRFVWDILAGVVTVFVFSCFAFAPRNVMPGQRIPRPQARRMVAPMSAARARQLAGKTRGIL